MGKKIPTFDERETVDVSGLLDEGAEEVHGFLPMRYELLVLVKHWMTEQIAEDFFYSCYPGYGRSGRERFRALVASHRIQEIVTLVGEDAVKQAVAEAYKEYGERHPGEAWRSFLGTPEKAPRVSGTSSAVASNDFEGSGEQR